MQKEVLRQLAEQSRKDCTHFVNKINSSNANFRLTEQTASVQFNYRHIGETMNLIGKDFGYSTTVEGTTMGKTDNGRVYDLEESKSILEKGYSIVDDIVDSTKDNEWLGEIESAWFGKISRIKLFSILLLHNSHHAGQIASALVKGKLF